MDTLPEEVVKFGIIFDAKLIEDSLRAEHAYLWTFKEQDNSGAVDLGIKGLIKQKQDALAAQKGNFNVSDGTLLTVDQDGTPRVVPYAELKILAQPQAPTANSAEMSPDQLTKQLIAEALRVQAASFNIDKVQQSLIDAGYVKSEVLMAPVKFAKPDGSIDENRFGQILRSKIIEEAIKNAI